LLCHRAVCSARARPFVSPTRRPKAADQ
jgi:hypothetical protein